MAGLPEDVKRSATRRHYAQIVHRVMQLAVYPCRLIAANPLPKGFLPKIGRPPAYPYLYPAEDARLLSHAPTPLCFRLLYGFLSREGCREGEAFGLRVQDFDLETGTISLDDNKTDDPRTWPLDPGTRRALRVWVAIRTPRPGDYMFIDENGGPLTPQHRLAEALRSSLYAAGATRAELHSDGTNRRKLRVHDLRATFVTLSLANGETETWVADRTGHRSSQMINRYRRQARTAHELGLGRLLPLDQAIEELCQRQPTRDQWRPDAAPTAVRTDVSTKGERGDQDPDRPFIAPNLVSRDGIEPPTRGFSILCSTD
jgi:integrase